ncbi:MAG: hypothetical protein E4G96_02320 [Chrysiogenales bacterium]|nr:MAG: hypothetical protein E4G96_02320 [Chrysiogenales bacterium]
MAVSKAERAAYNDEIKDIKREVDQIRKTLNEVATKKKKSPSLANYYNFEMASLRMDSIEGFVKMNDLSVEMLGLKNSGPLENARKEYYRVLQDMEDVVGQQVDRSLKENDEHLATVNRLSTAHILAFVKRMHRILETLKNRFGQDSKWKWSFVDLQARTAVIIKNITSFSEIARLRDPRSPYFYERRDLMQLCKDTLTEAARQYRTKYEMAGKARDDLKKSIDYLSALRKIHVLFGEEAEASKLKNILDAGKMTLEAEDREKVKNKKEKDRESLR